ncbi:MAG: helix-turn-helix domain-containing protein [Xanthomonadales bacterium]|nr:AraC family transcriptional regulator [Gammaproteobacteria bacterium]MBT8065507.1 AraC family transcriptional regulator [Gammaproteobacteria bacterium]NNJ65788.1 helix-turn-helix domain-containing protein [Xanthomonadales bacterium]NNK33818.1 helix-turn-helix domain-containing protein [Xanthomonadales bacterium]
MQSVIDIPSRQQEESRIVVRWLNRLHDCIRSEPGNLFAEAVNRTGLARHQLQSGDGLTHEHFDKVMEHVARRVPDLTFRFFREAELTDLGMLGYAILSCPTVGKAMSLMARYMELTSDRYTEQHQALEGFHCIRPLPTWRHFGSDVSIAEDCLAGNWKAVTLMLGPEADLTGAQASFAFPEPDYGESYRSFFQPCRIRFETDQTELRLPQDWLNRPVTTANLVMSDVTSAICERMLGLGSRSGVDTPRAVRRLLLSRPGQHMLRLDEAAEQLRMSTAQLRKRLYRAGTNYKNIVLEVRMALASHYLESTHLSIQEIAYLLDYAQPGPFSRAFKKYYGHSPSKLRGSSLADVSGR